MVSKVTLMMIIEATIELTIDCLSICVDSEAQSLSQTSRLESNKYVDDEFGFGSVSGRPLRTDHWP